MSRHEIPAWSPAQKVIVGWDHPLQTFFLQVIDRRQEEAGFDDKFVTWDGCSPREIYEIDQLAKLVRPYAELSTDMRAALYADKDEGR